MFEVYIRRDFSAAHQLMGYKGDCSRLHGHNWSVTIHVQSEKLDDIGISVDFRRLKNELDLLLSELDHSNLNDLDYFSGTNPTSEQIAAFIFRRLSGKLNSDEIKVSRVTISESVNSGASYYE